MLISFCEEHHCPVKTSSQFHVLIVGCALAMGGCGKPYDPEDMVEVAHWAIRQPPSPKLAEVLKPYLRHPNAYFRHEAAEILLRMGDTSGVPTLLEMVNSPTPVFDSGTGEDSRTGVDLRTDYRVFAPEMLAAFNQVSAADAVAALYFRMVAEHSHKASYVRSMAAVLGARQVIPWILEDAKKNTWPDPRESCFEDLLRLA